MPVRVRSSEGLGRSFAEGCEAIRLQERKWPPMRRTLLARLCIRQSCREMCLQSLSRTRMPELYVALGTVDVVSQDVQLCPISLCLDSHSILRL